MNKIALIFSISLLSACGGANINVKSDPVERVIIHPAPPAEMTLREVEWKVLNKERLEELLEEGGDDIVFFALTTENYEDLGLNMQEIIRYIREQKDIIIYYRKLDKDDKESEE